MGGSCRDRQEITDNNTQAHTRAHIHVYKIETQIHDDDDKWYYRPCFGKWKSNSARDVRNISVTLAKITSHHFIETYKQITWIASERTYAWTPRFRISLETKTAGAFLRARASPMRVVYRSTLALIIETLIVHYKISMLEKYNNKFFCHVIYQINKRKFARTPFECL